MTAQPGQKQKHTHPLAPPAVRCNTATRASAALVLYLARKQSCDHAGAMQLATMLNLKCKEAPPPIVKWIGTFPNAVSLKCPVAQARRARCLRGALGFASVQAPCWGAGLGLSLLRQPNSVT